MSDVTVAFFYDVPGNPKVYAAIKAEIGPDVPDGLITHLVLGVGHVLRHVMVWDDPANWERFRTSRVEPAVRRVLASIGIDAPSAAPEITKLDLVDAWTPAARPQAHA